MNSPTGAELPRGARVVQDWLAEHGYELDVVELPDSTRTAADAAEAIGCEIGQIVKSLVFRAQPTGRPVLILASGANRVDESLIRSQLGEKISKPDAAFVREATGFTIGGIPPVGHTADLATLIDQDLMQYSEIWAAAGTPFAVFRLSPELLVEMTGGPVVRIA
ncbi:MAG: YbaK/EbsC family protein [Anaerolineales bacterium]|nr:YbaK/EbsC family protein [Anaerolineales bacterium]